MVLLPIIYCFYFTFGGLAVGAAFTFEFTRSYLAALLGGVLGLVCGILLGALISPFAAIVYILIIVAFIGQQLKVLAFGIFRIFRKCLNLPEPERMEEKVAREEAMQRIKEKIEANKKLVE